MYESDLPNIWALGFFVLPWLTLLFYILGKGVFRLGIASNDKRPNLTYFWILSCFALAPRYFTQLNLLDWQDPLLVGLCAGLLLTLATWRFLRQPRGLYIKSWASIVVVAWWFYGINASILLNMHPKSTQQKTIETMATFKQVADFRLPLFSLKLSPWEKQSSAQFWRVNRTTFNEVAPGSTVCVAQNTGVWGWQWITVNSCEMSISESELNGYPAAIYKALLLNSLEVLHRGSLLQLLIEKKYDELDKQLNALQQQFEQGEIDSEILQFTYRNFYDPNPKWQPLYAQLRAQFPKSYPAALAQGIYQKFQAEAIGYSGFEKSVSFNLNVETYLDKQIETLLASTKLTQKPLLSYSHLLDAAMHRGQRRKMREWYDAGAKTDPNGIFIKRKYLAMLRPMYGGTVQQMQAFVDENHQNGTSQKVLNSLDAMMATHYGWIAESDGREDDALTLFRKASALEPTAEEWATALAAEGGILNKRKQYEEAVVVLQKSIEKNSKVARTHGQLAFALYRISKKEESFAATKRGAELGDRHSQTYLGQLYLGEEGFTPDTQLAGYWLRKAAAQGDEKAQKLILENPHVQ